MDDSQQPGSPAGPNRKRKLWPWVAVVVAVVAVVVVVAFFVLPSGGDEQALKRRLELLEEPAGGTAYVVHITDSDRIQQAIGTDFPADGSEDEIEGWVEEAGDGEDQRVLFYEPDRIPARKGLDYDALGEITLFEWGGGLHASLLAYDGDFSAGDLDGLFGSANDEGQWETGTVQNTYFMLDGDTVYGSQNAEALPDGVPEPSDSLAANEEPLGLLKELDASGGYHLTANVSPALIADDGVEVPAWGYALDVEDDSPHLTLVIDHESEADAEGRAEVVKESIEEWAVSQDQSLEVEAEEKGTFVVASFSFAADERGLRLTVADLANSASMARTS